MSSLSRRPSPYLWDSTMCLDCFWRHFRRHSSSTLRPRVRAPSTPVNNSGDVRATRKSLRSSAKVHPQRTTGRNFESRPSSPPLVRSFTTSTFSAQLDSYIRRGGLKPPPFLEPQIKPRNRQETQAEGPDIRTLLRQWQPQASTPITTLEPTLETVENGMPLNNFTRPESLDNAVNNDLVIDEHAQSYIRDFDRITEASAGANNLGSMLKRGDLVELRGNMNSPLFGVYLGISQNKYFQFYTISGRLYSAGYRTAQFQVDGYFEPSELDALAPFIPAVTEEADMDITIPRNISAPILTKIVNFREGYERMYRKYSSAIDAVYDRLAHAREPRYMLLEDIVSEITEMPVDDNNPFPPELLFAVSHALIRERYGFTAEMRSYAWTRVLCIWPKENAVIVDRVQRWLRAFQEDAALVAGGFEVPKHISKDALMVKSFVRKCHKLIAESRALRQYSHDGIVICGPAKTTTQGKSAIGSVLHSWEFTDADREFIRVLKLHTMGESLFRHPTYRSLSSNILRAVGLYNESELREDLCWSFLIELGVIEPYTHGQAYDTECCPNNETLTEGLSNIDAKMAEGVTGVEAMGLKDSMHHIRRDWGDLPVYCIDSESTEEVDDGISLERIPDEPDNVWIHVHVSHISAFTRPDDLLGKCALHRLTSVYLVDGKVTMLPEWAGNEFSLAADRPCLTYSAKVTRNGEMLEYKIQAGLLHNVLYMTPTMVNKGLDESLAQEAEKPAYLTITCGKPPTEKATPRRPLTEPSEEDKKTLRELVELCRRIRDQRVQSPIGGIFSQDLLVARVADVPGESRTTMTFNPTHAQYNLKDPFVELKINHDVDVSSGDETKFKGRPRDNADMMVEQCMLLTNVIAGKWAHERKIPIIYTGTRPAVEGLEDITTNIRKDVLQGNWDNNYISTTLLNLYAVRVFTTFPVEQKIMGTPEYAKVTSPLRRLFDLLSSWQLDAALLHEHSTDTSLVGRVEEDDTSFLPYQRAEIEKSLRIWVARSQDINWFQSANVNHWVVQAIARAFYLNEAPLPSPLTCEIGKVRPMRAMGKVRELEFNVMLKTLADEEREPLVEGDVWEVKIVQVIPWGRQVVVVPVRKLERGSRIGGLRKKDTGQEPEQRGVGEQVAVAA